MSKIFALLIGINDYTTKPLNGCINDVEAMKTCLEKLYGNNSNQLITETLITKEQTTKQSIISHFQNHFKEAQNSDICIFYYSGHGSYAKAPKEFKSSNGNLQSFVCSDSRDFGGIDLVDKEMAYLIWAATKDKPEVNFLIITDCCHSGTITKAFLDNNQVKDRRMSGDESHIPLTINDYLGYGVEHDGELGYKTYQEKGETFIRMKNGRHLHLSACLDSQTAKELQIANQVRGAFTSSLIKSLYASSANISYRELCEQISAVISSLVADQSPSFNIIGENNLNSADNNFLSIERNLSTQIYIANYDPTRAGWTVNAGTIHNVHPGDFVILEDDIETVVIAGASADKSLIRNQENLDPEAQYKARIIRQAAYTSAIDFGPEIGEKFKRQVNEVLLNHNNEDFGIHLANSEPGQFILHSDRLDNYFITLSGSKHPLLQPEKLYHKKEIELFLNAVSSIAKWHQLKSLKLSSPVEKKLVYEVIIKKSFLPGEDDKENFVPIAEDKQINDTEHKLHYKLDGNKWYAPRITIEIKNNTKVPIWVTNAYLGFDYQISNRYFSEIEIAGDSSAFLEVKGSQTSSEIISLKLDQHYLDLGYDRITEYLKLFISSQKIPTENLNQEDRSLPNQNQRGINKSGFVEEKSPEGRIPEIPRRFAFSETIGFQIISASNEIDIKQDQSTAIGALRLKPHGSFGGKATLSSESNGNKSIKNVILKPSELNENLEPLSLNNSSRSLGTSSILELFNTYNHEEVSVANPLKFDASALDNQNISEILPLGYDAKENLYYPLGYGDNDSKEIIIHTLPEETDIEGEISFRSFTGSIKIYFQKVIGQKLGFKYNYPRLAKVVIDNENQVNYIDSIQDLKLAVAEANNILLFVHGIIGDTTEMVKCVNLPLDSNNRTLSTNTELILSFDYENLNTPIEQTAKDLKNALESIGLKAGHKKSLSIIAHSMGGLVSRWFIEKECGGEVVNKLIMLGTPNNGTPWSDIRDIAAVLLTFAINGASYFQPYLSVLNTVGKLIQGVQVTLKQMNECSELYQILNSANQNRQHIIISGNTQKLPYTSTTQINKIHALFEKLKRRGLYDSLDLAIFKESNDIAVSTKSISTIREAKNQPQVFEVASDHLSYFSRPEVISIISEQL